MGVAGLFGRPRWSTRVMIVVLDIVLSIALALVYSVLFYVMLPFLEQNDVSFVVQLLVISYVVAFVARLALIVLEER